MYRPIAESKPSDQCNAEVVAPKRAKRASASLPDNRWCFRFLTMWLLPNPRALHAPNDGR
jgi:hypothetical protein